jgi:hypothetical protein
MVVRVFVATLFGCSLVNFSQVFGWVFFEVLNAIFAAEPNEAVRLAFLLVDVVDRRPHLTRLQLVARDNTGIEGISRFGLCQPGIFVCGGSGRLVAVIHGFVVVSVNRSSSEIPAAAVSEMTRERMESIIG